MTLQSEGSFPSDEVWFNELYKQRPTKDPTSASMVIYAEGASEQVRQITNVEHFSKKPFDDLWQEAITPRYKLDRSYRYSRS
jgi:hypothetical protein